MNYVDPRSVTSPRNRIKGNVDPVVDKGEDRWSISRIVWDGRPAVGIRWNGSFSRGYVGTPQLRGNPSWFILPDEVAKVILKAAEEGAFDEGGEG